MKNFARSVSQRRTLRSCGIKYTLHYKGRWRQKVTKASWLFGSAINHCIDLAMRQGGDKPIDIVEFFQFLWDGVGTQPSLVLYPDKKPWKWWLGRGIGLLPAVLPELLTALRRDTPLFPFAADKTPYQLQARIYYNLPGGQRELSIPDYIGHVWVPNETVEGMGLTPSRFVTSTSCRAVIDFKTSDKEYDQIQAEKDDQLTFYQLAAESMGFQPDVVGLCVLIYQDRNPRIQWVWARARDADEKRLAVASAQLLNRQILAEEFVMNDRHCFDWGGCEYQPLCFKSQAHRREAELYQEPPRDGDEDEEDILAGEL